jgi:hypothetical protein
MLKAFHVLPAIVAISTSPPMPVITSLPTPKPSLSVIVATPSPTATPLQTEQPAKVVVPANPSGPPQDASAIVARISSSKQSYGVGEPVMLKVGMLVAQIPPSPGPVGFPRPIGSVATPYPIPTIPRMQAVPMTPRPIPTATGDPHKFRLEVRPLSSERAEVFVLGTYRVPGYAPIVPTTPTPVWHGTGTRLRPAIWPVVSPSNLPDPALNEINERDALQLSVKDDRGHIVAHGVPEKTGYEYGGASATLTSQTVTFDLDRQLLPDRNPYTITVRWRATPDVSASSRLLISFVPVGADVRLGGRFIAPPYGPADIFRLSGGTGDYRHRDFVSEGEPHKTRSIADNGDVGGLGPLVSDPDVEALRVKYIGVPVYTTNYEFDCVDAHGWGAVAKLNTGKSLRMDTISRVGHVMNWLPDDPRQRVYSYPCNGDCSKHQGVFTDSPLVAGFALSAGDTTILPEPSVVPSLFDGQCERGYAVLQNPKQFHDIFSISEP